MTILKTIFSYLLPQQVTATTLAKTAVYKKGIIVRVVDLYPWV